MKIVLLGAPGSGKGTQAQKLTKEFSIPQISTGDIFRKHLKEETPLGVRIKSIMAKGDLVPDDIVVEIVKARLCEDDCKNGYILDGFPRSMVQAQALDGFAEIDYVIDIDVDKESIIKRLSDRRFCADCNGTFSSSQVPNGICPSCGGKVVIREDDKEETVRARLNVYDKTTAPLIDYYKGSGKLVHIDGNASIDEVYDRILSVLK